MGYSGEYDADDREAETRASIRRGDSQVLQRASRNAQPLYPRDLTPHLPPRVPSGQETLHDGSIEVAGRPQVERLVPPPLELMPPLEYVPRPFPTNVDEGSGSPPPTLLARPRASALPTSSLTPRFAPAYYTPEISDGGFGFPRANSVYEDARRAGRRPHARYFETNANLLRYASLHPNLVLAQADVSTSMPPSDGLGDRRRSLSPEEDTWETLLTTITPDERLPSASSSFTSVSASASASASASFLSSNTSTRPATTRTTPLSTSNVCDDPSDSDWSDDNPSDEDLDFSYRSTDGNLRNIGGSPTPGSGLQYNAVRLWEETQSQRLSEIAERLTRHEPVSDESWASAGFVRSFGGRNDRLDRERL